MRIRRYLFAECCFLGLVLLAAVWTVRKVSHWVFSRPENPPLAASVPPSEHRETLKTPKTIAASGPTIAVESTGTFLGMADDLLLERLRRQRIVKTKLNKGGSSLSFRLDLEDGSRAAFKPAQTNLQTMPRKEVAAYRISRLLGLDAVPPAVPRLISREELFSRLHADTLRFMPRIRTETIFNPAGKTAGVMMYWVPVVKDPGLDTPAAVARTTTWLTVGQPIPPSSQSLAAQLSDLVVFDFLIANPDRYSGGNLLTTADGSRVLFMDNTLSFLIEPQGPEKNRVRLHRTQRFSQRLFQALDRISQEALTRMLAQASEGAYEILTAPEIRAVVSRRDYMSAYITSLMATHGSAQVLWFP